LRDYAAKRLSLAVRRFGHRLRHATVRLVDENEPRRDADRHAVRRSPRARTDVDLAAALQDRIKNSA
jgi:hypothetical protein